MRYLFAILFSAVMISVPAIYRSCSKGFRLDKLWEVEKEQEVFQPTLSEELKALLHQDFYYLKQGTQSYVFESEDKKYVLKLFRYEQPHNFIYRWIRTELRHRPLRLGYDEQRKRLFSACRIAEKEAKEETALVAIHLNQTENLWPTVKFHTPMGRSCKISLDKSCFAIQKKGDLIFKSLASSARLENSTQMRQKLDSLHSLLKTRTDKGIVNLDWNLNRNFGFLENRAIELDFGAYDFASQNEAEIDFLRFHSAIRKWLCKRAPEWVSYWENLNEER